MTNELVYNFQNQLKTVPLLENLAIAGINPEKLPTNENAVSFQIKCKFAGSKGTTERKTSDG